MNNLIEKLERDKVLEKAEFIYLLENQNKYKECLFELSRKITDKVYGNKIFVRGLIEISNFCKNGCYYCGISNSNKKINRYRLSKDEIIESFILGYEMGFKTFVLQGGEDPYLNREFYISLIKSIKSIGADCAVTLSIGEWDRQSLCDFKEAGADRFLLRHESINKEHYYKLHPKNMSLDNRLACLKNLKEIGYETGSGIMVGSPYQTYENIAEDLLFLHELQPHMIGIGPYVSQKDTIFKNFKNGSSELSIFLIGILRLMFNLANIPATTSLQTISKSGREDAIKAGANVFMPNLTPKNHRKDYALYDNKACFKLEAFENLQDLKERIASIGYEIVMDRGDSLAKNNGGCND